MEEIAECLLLVMEQEGGIKLEAKRIRWPVTWPPLLTLRWEGVTAQDRTVDDRRAPSNDINCAWPRRHSPTMNVEEEASFEVVICMVKSSLNEHKPGQVKKHVIAYYCFASPFSLET